MEISAQSRRLFKYAVLMKERLEGETAEVTEAVSHSVIS